jgi:hypothetical protein
MGTTIGPVPLLLFLLFNHFIFGTYGIFCKKVFSTGSRNGESFL